MYYIQPFSRLLLLILSATCLTACMLGPNFHRPSAPLAARYTEVPLAAKTKATKGVGSVGKAQHFVKGKDISASWWKLFHSKDINYLVNRGIANSPSLTAAYAALRQAQENYNVQVGNSFFPAFDATLSGQRQLFNSAFIGGAGSTPSSIFNLFNASVAVSYTLDVFGAARRQVEALGAQVDYQQFELIAAYLSLTSNIVTTAITIASLQTQIDVTRDLVAVERGQLEILKGQYKLGGISLENVMTQQVLVSQTESTLPALEKSLSMNKHALSTLIGAYTEEPLPVIRLSSLSLPQDIPVSIPSNMVRQRPDIRAAEALMHAALAQVGVATANLLPQFTITGNYGWQAVVPANLFATQTNLWSIGSSITQPIFHGGALLAQRRAAIAAYEQMYAQYKQAVLQGLQNVADSLRALETDARALNFQKEADRAASINLKMTADQYKLGGVNYINLLVAQQQFQQAHIALVKAEAARFVDTVALFQSLGGGWWNKEWCVKQCF